VAKTTHRTLIAVAVLIVLAVLYAGSYLAWSLRGSYVCITSGESLFVWYPDVPGARWSSPFSAGSDQPPTWLWMPQVSDGDNAVVWLYRPLIAFDRAYWHHERWGQDVPAGADKPSVLIR
jgi:hypothetical protein